MGCFIFVSPCPGRLTPSDHRLEPRLQQSAADDSVNALLKVLIGCQ
jgi:hypothetical protein